MKTIPKQLIILLSIMTGMMNMTTSCTKETDNETVIINGVSTALIPAGTFMMGSPTTEVNRNPDEIQHQVTLSAFRMSKYEITNAQYAAFMNAKGIDRTQALTYSKRSWGGLTFSGSQWVPTAGYETSPISGVSWFDASAFAAYVGGTLPTEAQWEYACRAGTTTPFNTGNYLTNLHANYYWKYPYNGGTNSVTTSLGKTQPVGSYAPNAFGIYDMHGNVTEWCSDCYGTYPTTPQINPTGIASSIWREVRGGHYGDNGQDCRSANRNEGHVSDSISGVGFRVVFVP